MGGPVDELLAFGSLARGLPYNRTKPDEPPIVLLPVVDLLRRDNVAHDALNDEAIPGSSLLGGRGWLAARRFAEHAEQAIEQLQRAAPVANR